MTLEEAEKLVAEIENDHVQYISGPREINGIKYWRVDGNFTADSLEALAVVLRERRS